MSPIALYARVSTDDQHPEVQLAELRAYAKRRDVEVVEYVDHGVSGQRSRRPALDQMLCAARRQEVSAVVAVAALTPATVAAVVAVTPAATTGAAAPAVTTIAATPRTTLAIPRKSPQQLIRPQG